MTAPDAPVLRLCGISKRFGPLLANDDISLDLQRGQVLALLGENGAGKSTLMAILFGHYRADAGHIEVFGRRLPPGQPRAALAAGIGMVHQHCTLADNLTVLDNLMLGSEPLWQPFSRRSRGRAKLLAVARQFGLPVQPDARVGSLSVGERQRVEILKALYRGARILILDEPTAMLTPQESQALFDTLAQMVAQGLAIIFISHKLAEVLRVSHRVAVLRQGRLVAQMPAQGATPGQLAQSMVGHAGAGADLAHLADLADTVDASARRRPALRVGAPVCTLRQVSTAPAGRAGRHGAAGAHGDSAPAGRGHLRQVSLTLLAGEIMAIAGVSGNGQRALADLLCGLCAASAGQVTLRGVPLRASPAWVVRQGVARIPEDRHAVGLVGELPVWENAVSERLRSRWFAHPWFLASWVKRRAARAHARRVIDTFDVRGGGPDAPARSLSGGNMQKLILGRALLPVPDGSAAAPAPGLIVAHQPCWGLDIGAVLFVQQQLLAARDAGAAVLLISDDLDEVLALGDRVAVLHDGQLSAARPAQDWTREAIGLAMAGAGAGAGASTAATMQDGHQRRP
ncbi:ABC transporter ATP-binding protein [Verminephrobacter eiseniae]|uniref:ABC transporter ATP-binding protein n=1 Tax=Verminephrobacter eiseniae TaxID=364317 RepID=UPI002237E745|nr:ABC transporter ATP-binding protein [Verminephrobacter eiseniae]MCW5230433.1 ABC transporter ATP-binding protein [Verminephrobacter eiseniae]MCW8184326.1 ABC transporter ATP-binding protein [Verminephrobacter eiseniae]MCW8223134.1 ABC transporter ATP-binding protein [Verminephrobacter eiseniae]MCW8234843.1 ABC transporter ATP-binding protein [Verminephrobacter eiseniae]